jgi:hypothetical protein
MRHPHVALASTRLLLVTLIFLEKIKINKNCSTVNENKCGMQILMKEKFPLLSKYLHRIA